MAGFFDDLFGEPTPEDFEEQIRSNVPPEAYEQFDVTVSRSELWDQYSPEDQVYLSEIYGDAVVTGDLGLAEEFLEYLEVEWDDYDVHEFYEIYEASKG